MSQTLKPLNAKVARLLAKQITAALAVNYAGCRARDAARASDRTSTRTNTESFIERLVYAESALRTLIGAIAGRDAELDMGAVFDHGNDRPRAERYTHGRHLRECAEDAAKPSRRATSSTTAAAQVQP